MDNTQSILLSELSCASAYVDRIFNTITHLETLYSTKTVQTAVQELNFELSELLETGALLPEFINENPEYLGLRDISNRVKSATMFSEALIKLSFDEKKVISYTSRYINKLYHFCFVIHNFIATNEKLQLEYPRMNMIETVENELTKDKEIPLFQLSEIKILNILEDNCEINSLAQMRESKYESFIREGHEQAFVKNHQIALQKFHKALNYKETAEVYTLIAWVHSLLNNLEDAKNYCIKAINVDPDYGPPYNDLGSYLLKEGAVEESLKWFTKAKKAINYQNREYPYINSGRAYMNIKNIPKAFEEFSMALTLAPYHQELHDTVEKLKKTLSKTESPLRPKTPEYEI